MSCYGYPRLTTPHLDRLARSSVLFERNYCPQIPTPSGRSSMLTGLDAFGTQVVALRHQGSMNPEARTLPEILRESGYVSTCIGLTTNVSSRGFDRYLEYSSWGVWNLRPLRKAENLNDVALPELERLAKGTQPFFLYLPYMDPHSPYLPPSPFDRLFYGKNPCDPSLDSIRPAMNYKPLRDYYASWMPPGITDADYVVAQYDGAVAYMDACIQSLLTRLEELGIADDTLIVLNGDHGETLTEHDCYFDHHGLYDCTLHVPLLLRHPKLPAGERISGFSLHQDLVPTILDLLEIETDIAFDGRSLLPMIRGEDEGIDDECYITECAWMRKHGWRTPEWKLIVALEPDSHFKPEIELYRLATDPTEDRNVAEEEPEVVATLRARMDAWIAKREKETGRPNPMFTHHNWHGAPKGHQGPFQSSQQAYDLLYLGDPNKSRRLRAIKRRLRPFRLFARKAMSAMKRLLSR